MTEDNKRLNIELELEGLEGPCMTPKSCTTTVVRKAPRQEPTTQGFIMLVHSSLPRTLKLALPITHK